MAGLGGWKCFEEGLSHWLGVSGTSFGSFAGGWGLVVDSTMDLTMNLTSLVGVVVLLSLVSFRSILSVLASGK